jgi:hypothetical protein
MGLDLSDAPVFTDDQLRALLRRVGQDAHDAAFKAGQSVIVLQGASLVAIHPDGTRRVVENLPPESDSDTNG